MFSAGGLQDKTYSARDTGFPAPPHRSVREELPYTASASGQVTRNR